MATYAHIVGGLDNGQVVELTDLDIMALSRGEYVEFGPGLPPRKVELEVYGTTVMQRAPAHERLLDSEVKRLLNGTRSYRGFAIEDAQDRFGLPATASMRDIERAMSDRIAEARLNGEEMSRPSWMDDAAYNNLFNEASSGEDFFTRQSLLFELALDGRISTEEYLGAMPTYTEVGAICRDAEAERRAGKDMWYAWYGELLVYEPAVVAHIAGTITGTPVVANDMAVEHAATHIVSAGRDTAMTHLRRLQHKWEGMESTNMSLYEAEYHAADAIVSALAGKTLFGDYVGDTELEVLT